MDEDEFDVKVEKFRSKLSALMLECQSDVGFNNVKDFIVIVYVLLEYIIKTLGVLFSEGIIKIGMIDLCIEDLNKFKSSLLNG